jgi:DNA-binding transcriptional ArsR family regulator
MVETNPFDVLADETRVKVLRALADRYREAPEDPFLSFSELRRRAGVRDSGNFNYHLGELRSRFVADTDRGYRLTNTGISVVTSLYAGTYDEGDRTGPAKLDETCPTCGEPLEATYSDSVLSIACPNDYEYQNVLPPGALADRTLPEAVDLFAVIVEEHVELARAGGCPKCYGRVEWSVTEIPEPTPAYAAACDRCGIRLTVPVGGVVARHPEVLSFYARHGIDPRDRPPWTSTLSTGDAVERVADDPPKFRVTVEEGDDRLHLTLDESATVTDVSWS